jgi:hypothetical protein
MAEIWLLCEGTSDVPVLSAVLTSVLAADIIVRASGGSSNAPSAAEYVARQDGSVAVAYVVDRDYCGRDKADATFTDGKRGFMWRRHAIESYLLAPAVIVEAFRSMRASVAGNPGRPPAWVATLPVDEAIVSAGLRVCARERASEEAARVAMHRLWEDLAETAGQVQKRNPGVPGGANSDADRWRQAFLEEAARLVAKAQAAATSPHLFPAAAGGRYDAELARVSGNDYVNDLRFLEEFNGRDLLGVFLKWLQSECHFKPSQKLFLRELEKAVPVAYKANRLLYGTDDFLDLANGVRALAGLPPIV